jgi:hypothetical protein
MLGGRMEVELLEIPGISSIGSLERTAGNDLD